MDHRALDRQYHKYGTSLADLQGSSEHWKSTLIRELEAAREYLSDRDQCLLLQLQQSLTQSVIARREGISQPAVSRRYKTVVRRCRYWIYYTRNCHKIEGYLKALEAPVGRAIARWLAGDSKRGAWRAEGVSRPAFYGALETLREGRGRGLIEERDKIKL